MAGQIILLTLSICVVTCSAIRPKKSGYEACPIGMKDKLNVHLVCHTHNDVGWLKTVDQYFYGANQSIQRAGVQYILDSVVESLQHDPKKKFIYVETAFFSRWWNELHDSRRHVVKKLVCNGQLEFIGGGWSMNDEAATHYQSTIDQMTLGLRVLKDLFGECGVPKVAWQIDPFGHSREQAALLALMYFDGIFLGRIDYQDKDLRMQTKTMEHIWKSSINLGLMGELFTGVLPNNYGPPWGFCFDILCDDPPIMDDPDLKGYNVEERVFEFIASAKEQAKYYASNHIIMTMGNDFNYQNAGSWYKNLDKLIKHVNEKQTNGSNVNVFYSTPSCYLHSLNKASLEWPTKQDDFLPYASDPHAYWTGFFTSRPALKRYERIANNELQVCKQMAALTDIPDIVLSPMRRAMGILQHHDAITGTAKQHVTDDYQQTAAAAIESCHNVTREAYEKQLPLNSTVLEQVFCNYLNLSQCEISEDGMPLAVTLYNPLAWNVSTYIRLPVTGKAYKILDPRGSEVKAQVVPIPDFVKKMAGRKSKADSEVVFRVDLPPLGFSTYLLRNTSSPVLLKEQSSRVFTKASGDWILENKFLSVVVDGKTGLLKQLRHPDGSNLTLNQGFHAYQAMKGNNTKFKFRASGAYIFRPNGTFPIGNNVTVVFLNGSLVQEVRQMFESWLCQTIRLYPDSEHVELDWIVGPIPVQDGIGKEIITRFDSDIQSGELFFTDSNGREIIQRRRNYRQTWSLNLTEPISSNYYPVANRIYLKDKKSQLTILTDRSQGGSSLKDGSLELMVHRRLLYDDSFGVDEPLNETGVDGKGLTIRGSHYIMWSDPVSASSKHRPLAQRRLLQPKLSLANYNISESQYMKNYRMTSSGLTTALPANVHLLTLEPWKKGTLLLRLEHMYEFDDDSKLSQPVDVPLKGLFSYFDVLALNETTLAANQWKEKAQRLRWNSSRASFTNTQNLREAALKDLIVHLTPMNIRTFVAQIKYK